LFFFQAVGFAFDVDDRTVVEQAVQDGGGKIITAL
jgi:hypothetical protein